MNTSSAQAQRLLAKLTHKRSKTLFQEFFHSTKNPKRMLAQFVNEYEKELLTRPIHTAKQEFRKTFFKDHILHHLSSKQYKRRKNAFYILNLLVQTDSQFSEIALKEFHKIKELLFNTEDLPNLRSLEATQDFLRFKVFINAKVLHWIDKFCHKYPDLHIWKKQQQRFFSIADNHNNVQSENFEDKYQKLRIYKTIYLRNIKEISNLGEDFQTLRFESLEARRFMQDKDQDSETNPEKVTQEEEKKDHLLTSNWDLDMASFIEQADLDNPNEDNLLFFEEDSASELGQEQQQTNKSDVNKISMNINSEVKECHKYDANDKNKTLYRVIKDNLKMLERRYQPLLEMFKVENIYFRELQSLCFQIATEKKELEQDYKGHVRITKKEMQAFFHDYVKVEEEELQLFGQKLGRLAQQVTELRSDLENIKLIVSSSNGREKVIVLDEEGEDPDEKFFK